MTYVGPPMIYYGTEAGMWGGDDPCDRMPMVWAELSYEPQQSDPLSRKRRADPVAFDDDLFRFYQAAIKFRHDNPALRRGDTEFVATDDKAEFLGFRRSDATDTLLVGLNRGSTPFKWKVPLANGEKVSQVFTASGEIDKFTAEQEGAESIVTVPAVDGVVLRVSSKK
jgi:glycosidase